MQQIPMPQPGLGTYKNTDPEECAEAVRMALEMGYAHVDTAQMYDNEAAVGEGIARADVDRDDVFLATKVTPANLAHDDVVESTETSLDRLGVDYVDLLYVHWPLQAYDARDTLPALDELRGDGTVEHVGLSNFTPDLMAEAREALDAPVLAHQVEMHPLLQQDELVAEAREHDSYLVAYAPVMRGDAGDVPELRDIAEKHGATAEQVSLAWLLAKDGVVPIPKATSRDHLRANWAAGELDLDAEDVDRIEAIDREERIVDPDDAPWNRSG